MLTLNSSCSTARSSPLLSTAPHIVSRLGAPLFPFFAEGAGAGSLTVWQAQPAQPMCEPVYKIKIKSAAPWLVMKFGALPSREWTAWRQRRTKTSRVRGGRLAVKQVHRAEKRAMFYRERQAHLGLTKTKSFGKQVLQDPNGLLATCTR